MQKSGTKHIVKTSEEIHDAVQTFLASCGVPAGATWECVSAGPCNLVYRVNSAAGVFALKYYGRGRGALGRLLTERAWYQLHQPQARSWMPEPQAWDTTKRMALFQWISGVPLKPNDLQSATLAELLSFVSLLNRARAMAAGRSFPPAAGSCFTLYDRLDAVGHAVNQAAQSLTSVSDGKKIASRLEAAWQVIMSSILRHATEAKVDPRRTLPLSGRILSAPDWGLHQAVRTSKGKLIFWDFDGAGWDDPAWWLAALFTRWELSPPLEYWTSFTASLTRLLGLEQETMNRATVLLPAARFEQICHAATSACQVSPTAARRAAFKRLEAALDDLASPRWWNPAQGVAG